LLGGYDKGDPDHAIMAHRGVELQLCTFLTSVSVSFTLYLHRMGPISSRGAHLILILGTDHSDRFVMILKVCVTCLQTRKMHITLKNHMLGKGITSFSIHAKSLLRIFHIGTHSSQKYAPTTLAINNFFRVNAFLPITLCLQSTQFPNRPQIPC